RYALLPKRPVIRPADAGEPAWSDDAFGWEVGSPAERIDSCSCQASRPQVPDKADEVAPGRIEETEAEGVLLAASDVRITPNCLERDHFADALFAPGCL